MRFKINISSINYDLGELVFGLFAQFGSEKRTNKVVWPKKTQKWIPHNKLFALLFFISVPVVHYTHINNKSSSNIYFL